jgi:hypothetical protein
MSLDSGVLSEGFTERHSLPRACPYLGLRNDVTSRYGYPNTRNYCHRVNPTQPVALDHQSSICLGGSQAYQNCPVNNDDWQGALPVELAAEQPVDSSRPRWHYFAMGGVVLVILLGIVLMVFNPFRPVAQVSGIGVMTSTRLIFDQVSPTAEIQASATEKAVVAAASSTAKPLPTGTSTVTATPTATKVPSTATNTQSPTVTPTNTATATKTATPQSPTKTSAPTKTPKPTSLTPTIGPGLETPFGPQGTYIIHKFGDGETLDSVADKYQTTVDVIRAINEPKNGSGIWGGTPLVIAVGELDVKDVRPLQALWLNLDTRLSYLAEKYTTPMDALHLLNGLGTVDYARGQRWIVVWRN